MTEEVKTVRDPLLVITAPARVPTLGEDFAAYDTTLVDACAVPDIKISKKPLSSSASLNDKIITDCDSPGSK